MMIMMLIMTEVDVKESIGVGINYRRIVQNHIFTHTEQKYMMLPFERGLFAVS
jgi:hypothetical protein